MNFPFAEKNNKKMGSEKLIEKVREIYNIELVNGVKVPLEEESFCEEQKYPIASFTNIKKAFKVTHEGGKYFRWESDPVPENLNMPYVVLVFTLGMGYGKPYPEPSGHFELSVNGEPAVDFIETKYSTKWEKNNYSFYFE